MGEKLQQLLDGIEKKHRKQHEIISAPTALELELLTLQQKEREDRKLAQAVFDRVMDAGSTQFGTEWLKVHMAIADEVLAVYLPTRGGGVADERMKALAAEIAYAILSKYRLTPR